TYKEFVIQQLTRKKQEEIADFWKKELEGYNRFTLWGAGHAEPNDRISKKRINHECQLEAILEKLTDAAKKHNTTVRNLCFAAYVFMLNMISYQNDIVVGFVINNRPAHEDGDKIIGCFLNTIPVRIKIPIHLEWRDYIRLVDKKLLELTRYNSLSLFEIAKITGEKAYDKNPIVDTIFNFSNFFVLNRLNKGNSDIAANEESEEIFTLDSTGDTNTILDFSVDTTFGGFVILAAYSKAIEDDAVRSLLFYFEKVLEKFIYEPGRLVDKEELIPVEERRKLLFDFNDTEMEYPKDKTINELFEDQAERTPDHVALHGCIDVWMYGEGHISYCELNERSNRLADMLKEKGVQSYTNNIVGIMMERSVEMIIGILGILKAGGAYLPLDLDYPQERIDYILADSNAKILVITPKLQVKDEVEEKCEQPQGLPLQIINVGGNLVPDFKMPASTLTLNQVGPSNLAYVIYTSGTTGRPKGVMIQHQSLVNLCYWHNRYLSVTGKDNATQYAGSDFDASVWEIFPYLLKGAALHLISDEIKLDIPALKDYYEKNNITIGFLPTQLYEQFIFAEEEKKNHSLRVILTGGDKLNRFIKKNYDLYNNYGPTENTVVTTSCIVKNETGNIPIGKPIANSRVYILNKDSLQLQPLGVPGELCIAGPGLSRGYLNRPEFTVEKFIEFTPLHSPIYKTGDLARWLPDGNIEFLGRIDFQVKIRGFRIELGEIESRLLKKEEIKEAVVLAKEARDGDRHLCAYIVSSSELNIPQLNDFLSDTLPHYMIPSYYVRLEQLPLTPGGKIDRGGLPAPQAMNLTGESEYTAPGTTVERILAETWEGVLGRSPIGINKNFFLIGGDSIKAIQVASRMNSLGYKLEVREIFRNPCISGLAAFVKKPDRVAQQSVITGPIPLSRLASFQPGSDALFQRRV
ncbi:amino acid adenylation domain-containing protein, partial [Acidobacteriota bacterium]